MTKAVINLSAVRHNLLVAKQAAPESKCIAIIKADAYGHGMLKIAQALTHADAFGVARIDEAIALRDAGITLPILLLEGFSTAEELELVSQYHLDSVVHHESQLFILEHSKVDAISVVLKIDSGMHRLGFNPDSVKEVIQRLQQCDSVNTCFNVMTHLANADDKQDDKTLKQLDVFYHSVEDYLKTNDAQISIANSAGILGWPQSHAGWIRPGIMLYGVSPFINSTANEHELQPVMTLSSNLIAVKKLKRGDAIGYGGGYVCDEDKTVGIVAIGYGDGYPRHAKTGTPVLINGQRCALLGRVSMDMICIDLSEAAKYVTMKVNDAVILWGEGLPVEEVAQSAGTIAYELLCSVTRRVKFVYTN